MCDPAERPSWVAKFEFRLQPDLAGKLTVVGLLAVAVLGAVLLYHLAEEPARRWMRSMVGDHRWRRAG